MKNIFLTGFILIFVSIGFSQESLASDVEYYYNFLSLQGLTTRPYLNYRTLSDSVWFINKETIHPWQEENFGKKYQLFNDIYLRIYGPDFFNSFNTAAPYGQNDGALWQSKGYNASLNTGVRVEAYGLELTFKPQLSFSQNSSFDFIQPNPSYANYSEKGTLYGYYGVRNIDAPQRFGDSPYFTYDWGDSEFRYTWKTLTIGFGTQPIWLGPAQINPIIHSNNAPSYPKFDFGIRRQSMVIPKVNLYIGDIEARVWWGYLSESDYFDNESSNDHNLITGFSLAYGVPILPGFSIGLNRTMLSKWDDMNYESVFTLLVPVMQGSAGSDKSDQRASIVFDYLFTPVGLDIYLEWARNDFSPGLDHIVKYPFHTEGFTAGLKKTITISKNKNIQGELLLEISKLEGSQDYDRIINWDTTFYSHGIISQGYTNRGQWIGAGIGTGGNSQYLGFKLYYPKGFGQFFVQRRNPDLDYTWYVDSKIYPKDTAKYIAEANIRAFLDFGLSGLYYLNPNLSITSSFIFRNEYNPLNIADMESNGIFSTVHRYNIYVSAGIKYTF